MSTAAEVYEMFKEHFDEIGAHYDELEDNTVLKVTARGEDLPQPTIIHVRDGAEIVVIKSPMPFRVPEDKRTEMAIAVVIANYQMLNGSFEMDMSDGELSYKIVQGYHGTDFSKELVLYMMTLTFLTTDRYNDKFFGLAMGMMSLEQFIDKISSVEN